MGDPSDEPDFGVPDQGPLDAGVPPPERPDAGFLVPPPMGLTGAEWVTIEYRWSAIGSAALGLAPIVGSIKGLIEAYTGRDSITGDKIDDFQRAFNVLAAAGEALTFIVRDAVILARLCEQDIELSKNLLKLADEAGQAELAMMHAQDALRKAEQYGDVFPGAWDALDTLAKTITTLDDVMDVYSVTDETMKGFRGSPASGETSGETNATRNDPRESTDRSPTARMKDESSPDGGSGDKRQTAPEEKHQSHPGDAPSSKDGAQCGPDDKPAESSNNYTPNDANRSDSDGSESRAEPPGQSEQRESATTPPEANQSIPTGDAMPNSSTATTSDGDLQFSKITEFATRTGPLGQDFSIGGCTGYPIPADGSSWDDFNGGKAGDATSEPGIFGGIFEPSEPEIAGFEHDGLGQWNAYDQNDFSAGNEFDTGFAESGISDLGGDLGGSWVDLSGADGMGIDPGLLPDLSGGAGSDSWAIPFDGGVAGLDAFIDPGLITDTFGGDVGDFYAGAWDAGSDGGWAGGFDSGGGGYSGPDA